MQLKPQPFYHSVATWALLRRFLLDGILGRRVKMRQCWTDRLDEMKRRGEIISVTVRNHT
jgi:hypothetical protein